MGLECLDGILVVASLTEVSRTTVKSAVKASDNRAWSSTDGIRVQALKTWATLWLPCR
jgi:hypothetical protein